MKSHSVEVLGSFAIAFVLGAVVCLAASSASGLWRGVCLKCGHDWIRYVAPSEAYSVCSFRPDGRGWCNGRIVWDAESSSR